jgi:hypothetical protein
VVGGSEIIIQALLVPLSSTTVSGKIFNYTPQGSTSEAVSGGNFLGKDSFKLYCYLT